jgi:hypothetical protein
MIIFLIILGIATLVVASGIGRSMAINSRNPTDAVGENNPNPAACREACDQWDRRRSEKCGAEADEAATRARADALRTELSIALSVVAGLLAAAIAAAALPAVGWLVAAGFFTAAGVAAATSSFIMGKLVAADEDVGRQEAASHEAREREAEAREIVLSSCPGTEADACLARSGPC